MELDTGHPKTLASKRAGKDDLKSLSLPEVEKISGSSPDGLSQAEAKEAAEPIWAE
jgi:hypothetical protein